MVEYLSKIKSILFISHLYPSIARPYSGAFVREYIRAIANMGVKCTVISPVSIFDVRYGELPAKISFDNTIHNNRIKIIRLRSLSFSNKQIFNYNTFKLTRKSFLNTVLRSLNHIEISIDAVYGHFLYPDGYAAINVAEKLKVPSFIAVGEAVNSNNTELLGIEPIGYQKAIEEFRKASGFISVSSLLKDILIHKLKIEKNKIEVMPNGVDLNLFFPRDKVKMRKKFNLPLDKTIIIFVGHFENRKGPQRILEAVSGQKDIGVVLIGRGGMILKSENILYKGILEHSHIPEMLSAGDIFVLPTLAEGSCNAIIEALACGLPVITSSDRFNDEIINDSVAIKIDPLDITEISNAIIKLKNNPELQLKMSRNATLWAKNFDIDSRVEKIIKWMEKIAY